VRLVAIVDAAADFARIADSTLRGLDAPTDPAERDRFRAAFRERLLSLWKRRLHGEPRVELRLVEGAAERPRLTVRRGGETFEVELTVATTADGPRIVDVAIDGAGLVATWRPRIAHTLERAGWAEVLERLGDR
jgi:ABC-type transporter MlaC component